MGVALCSCACLNDFVRQTVHTSSFHKAEAGLQLPYHCHTYKKSTSHSEVQRILPWQLPRSISRTESLAQGTQLTFAMGEKFAQRPSQCHLKRIIVYKNISNTFKH